MSFEGWVGSVATLPGLDGGGRMLAPVFEAALRGRRFKRCFEWCSGPAWVGFWLMECGIVDELVCGDVNPVAADMVRETAATMGYNAAAYVSDCMDGIPAQEFDLVVANPPNYRAIRADHSLWSETLRLRASDPGFETHRRFYREIVSYLRGEIVISEVEPFAREVVIGGEVYDERPVEPIVEFVGMLPSELRLCQIMPFALAGVQMALLRIKRG